MKKLSFLTLLITAALACASCAKDYTLVGTEREQGGDPIWLSTSVTVQNTRAAGAIAKNIPVSATETDMDNKVYSLRMIISDSQTGNIVYNERTDNPQEVEAKYNQASGTAAAWKKPIKIIPGTYDFWFIANEGVNWFAPVTNGQNDRMNELGNQVWDNLREGSNIARIFDGQVFGGNDASIAPLSHLDLVPYRKYKGRNTDGPWTPKVDDSGDLWANWSLNRPMPMSAVYKDVYIASTRNGKGASVQDPQHFIADGDEKVKLVRCMAKVTIIVKNAAYVKDNRTVRNLQWPQLDKFAITLLNRPRYWSFFNTPLFDMNHTPREFKYYSDIFPDDQSRYRAFPISVGGDNAPESFNGVPYVDKDKSKSEIERRDYQYTFYVPELLLEKSPLDGDPSKGEQAFDRTNALMLAFSAPNRGFWGRRDLFNSTPGAAENVNFYPYASKAEFEGKVEESKAFNIGTPDLEEVNDHQSPDSPKLLNPDRYSNFSLLRNRHYMITIREKDRLQVDAVIAPWDDDTPKSETNSFDAVQVNVPDPSFSATNKQMTLRIQNSFPKHFYSGIRISLLNQDGGENAQAYFSNVGTMRVLKRNGSNAVQLMFGTEAAHHKPKGFVDFTVNWSATTGKNAPAAGKAFIKLEYLDGSGNLVNSKTGYSFDNIIVRQADWSKMYRDLENAQ